MIKVAAPRMALKIIDDAIQAHGGAGVTTDAGLASAYASMRTVRLVDGPDEVHNRTIARMVYGQVQGVSTTAARRRQGHAAKRARVAQELYGDAGFHVDRHARLRGY